MIEFQVFFYNKCKISNFFTFKDRIPSLLRSGIAYKSAIYGKTKLQFKVRMCEHLGAWCSLGKEMKSNDDSAIRE